MTNPRFNIEGEQLQSLSSVPSFSSFVFLAARVGMQSGKEPKRETHSSLVLQNRSRMPPTSAGRAAGAAAAAGAGGGASAARRSEDFGAVRAAAPLLIQI